MANSQPKEDLFMDQRHFEYFAKRLEHMASEVDYVALIEISRFEANQLPATDIVLYRWRSGRNQYDQGKYEMLRFSPLDRERATDSFPYGPGGYPGIGREWQETTDWPADMTAPIKDPGLRVVKYPKNFPPYVPVRT